MIKTEYFKGNSRAEFAHLRYRCYLNGTVLDVGAGGSPQYFRKHLGRRYTAVDCSYSRAFPDVQADLGAGTLPFHDKSFDTVLCFDTLEHVDNPHHLFDECARVTRKFLVISLPNNWPGFLHSFIRGHNVSHQAGYGLPSEPRAPGDRHKWFFNIEEAERFVRHRGWRANLQVTEIRHVFERGTIGLFYLYPYPTILGISDGVMKQKSRKLLVAFLLIKYGIALPLSWLEEVFKQLVWGWGKYRYVNLFCRQLWVVLEKP